MYMHVHGFHAKDKLPCPECGVLFKGENNLKAHIRRGSHRVTRSLVKTRQLKRELKPRKEGKSVCQECGKSFSCRFLGYHMKSQHSSESKHCKECDKSFDSKVLLRYHKRNVHAPVEMRPCPDCGKVYGTAAKLYHHVRDVHTPATCAPCGLVFPANRKLDYHKSKVHKAGG